MTQRYRLADSQFLPNVINLTEAWITSHRPGGFSKSKQSQSSIPATGWTDYYRLAVETILASRGRGIVCGMGKSGIVGLKSCHAFQYRHAELLHASRGCLSWRSGDGEHPTHVFIAISSSGRRLCEVLKLIPFLRENGNYLIAMTGNPGVHAGPIRRLPPRHRCQTGGLPPRTLTSSTTATLAMGDALAVTLMEARDFKPEHFADCIPGAHWAEDY